MESEKVKEIKKVLEEGQFNTIKHHQHEGKPILISFADILTLIKELERENERLQNKNYQLEQDLGQCENGYKLELHTARYQMQSANEDLEKAKNRIAELEKENVRLDKVVKHNQELIENGKLISSEQLKQFAKMLKENFAYDIERCKKVDETLKEIIEE